MLFARVFLHILAEGQHLSSSKTCRNKYLLVNKGYALQRTSALPVSHPLSLFQLHLIRSNQRDEAARNEDALLQTVSLFLYWTAMLPSMESFPNAPYGQAFLFLSVF